MRFGRGRAFFASISSLAEQPEFGRRELIVEAENALRADFGETAAAGREPVSLRRQRRALREFPEVARELVEANDLLRRSLGRRRELETGALARFGEADPQVAISRLIASTDPAGDARRLVGTLQGDATALQGLRTALIEELWRRGGADPRGFSRLLTQPKVERLIQTVMSPQDLRRLDRIVAAASDISTTRQSIARTLLTGTARIGFRIGGAQVGRQLADITGGGTIQTPGLVSRAAAQTFDRLFVALPPEELLARAVVDSRWERTILSRAPKDLPEVRTLLRRVRRLLGAEAGARAAVENERPQPSIGDVTQPRPAEIFREELRRRAGTGLGLAGSIPALGPAAGAGTTLGLADAVSGRSPAAGAVNTLGLTRR